MEKDPRTFAIIGAAMEVHRVLARIIHERSVNNPECTANDQCPMTNPTGDARHPVALAGGTDLRPWSLRIGMWAFPPTSRTVFANNAG